MSAHGSDENGLSRTHGQLEYAKLGDTIRDAVSGYARLYAYGTAKTRFLANVLGQPVRNIEDFNRPHPTASRRNSVAVCLATRII